MNAFVILTAAAAAFAVPVDDHELVFVTFLHRHGDRSPVGTYPNDPHGNESLWNNGWGELTNAGKQNAFSLGKWLRERYADFLPKKYNRKDYEVQSTDVSRTLMSASLVLAGLYEPTGSDVWNPDVNWQPVPVHAAPFTTDNILAVGKPCPRRSKLQLRLMLEEIASGLDPVADALSEIVAHSGYDDANVLANFFTATMVYDSLNVQNQNGLELPEWSKAYYPQPLQDLSSLLLRIPAFNEPLRRLSCGLLVRNILEHFKSKIAGGLTQRMWQYSAHDITMVGLRQCLGLSEPDSPPYASALLLELSRGGGEHFVRVLYKADSTLTTLLLPGCTEFCPLPKFEELVSPVIPENWEAECEL